VFLLFKNFASSLSVFPINPSPIDMQLIIVTHSIFVKKYKGAESPFFLFKTFHTLAGSLTTTGIDPTH
ncbi:hypothetical protein OFN29_31440, partial [Escherichia coli]|nr:hypothetical protein [Escherichia coli]